MDFGDKADRGCRVSFWNVGIIFDCGGTQDISPREDGWFGEVKGHQLAKSTRGTRVADWARRSLQLTSMG